MTAWGPLRTSLFYAIVGPLMGALLLAAILGDSAAAWAPQGLDIIAVYIIGLPPLLATGFVVAIVAQRGRSFFSLALLSTLIGAGFGGLSALFYGFLVLEVSPTFSFFAAMAAAGGAAGLGCLIIIGALALIFRGDG